LSKIFHPWAGFLFFVVLRRDTGLEMALPASDAKFPLDFEKTADLKIGREFILTGAKISQYN